MICPTPSTNPQQLDTDYTGCVTSHVMVEISICPSCQKQREIFENICMSEIYRGMTLLSTSTVDSIYTGFYMVFIESCRAIQRKE